MKMYMTDLFQVNVKDNRLQVIGNGSGLHWTSDEIEYTPKKKGKTRTFEQWCADCGDDLQIRYGLVEDMTILWVYDNRPRQGNLGYAFNLDVPYFSEWGTAPFPKKGETHEQHMDRWERNTRAMVDAFGGEDKVAIIDVGHPEVTTVDGLVQRVRNEEPDPLQDYFDALDREEPEVIGY